MAYKKIDFYSEVKISNNVEPPEIRGRNGVVMAISEEGGFIYSYSVLILEDDEDWILDPDDITPTGKIFKRSDFYDGSSLGVTPDGKVTRVDIKGQESE